MVDATGLPIKSTLAPGHQHDNLNAAVLPDDMTKGGLPLADKAYDSSAIRLLIFSRGG